MSNYCEQEHEYMELKSQFDAEHKFDRFMDEINAKVEARYGLSVDDFADYDFWGHYDETAEEGTTGWENMVEGAFEDYRYELESEHKDFF
jgi:hypothetical protein